MALDWALSVLKQSNIKQEELQEYPVEGYYYKNNLLKLYFTIIRNLQENENIYDLVVPSKELEYLKILTDNLLFGSEPTQEYLKLQKKEPILKRRYDIMALAIKDIGESHKFEPRPWSISNILDKLSKYYTGNPNLVELAYLTNDPRCICCSCETNALYREVTYITGCMFATPVYKWNVSPEVEKMGKVIIDMYNGLIKSNMVYPSIYNCHVLKKSPELPRVSTLGKVILTGENYYWVLDNQENLTDIYAVEELTTGNYAEFSKKYL